MKENRLLKRAVIPLVAVVVLLSAVSGCAAEKKDVQQSVGASSSPEETSIPGLSVPAGPGGAQDGQENTSPGETDESQESPGKTSMIYDPSIYVIEAKGTWQQELAPGYYANCECELYIDKVDSNDSRKASGLYTGVFWMNVTLDADDFISDLLKDVPIDMSFAGGGEGICDNLTMHLLDGYMRDPFENFDIPAEGGEPLSPAQEALADSGSFIVSNATAYLEAHAQGAQGEELNYEDNKTTDTEMSYVIHVAPDPSSTATELKVTIYLTSSNGAPVTLEGTWRRLPGYPEDILEYANSGKKNEIFEKHAQ
jgi:hypothetical protein